LRFGNDGGAIFIFRQTRIDQDKGGSKGGEQCPQGCRHTGLRNQLVSFDADSRVIKINLSSLKRTEWHEYLVRFFLGGLVTVITGLIAKRGGPVVGGLCLAFPTIFPASATLVERHERVKKRLAGIAFASRGRLAAALDARGAAMGSLALIGFAACVRTLLPAHAASRVLTGAMVLWAVLAVLIWRLRKLHTRLHGA
jgi:hypothetical protein